MAKAVIRIKRENTEVLVDTINMKGYLILWDKGRVITLVKERVPLLIDYSALKG